MGERGLRRLEPDGLVQEDSMGIWRAHLELQTANEERNKNLTIMRDGSDNHILVQQFKSLRFKESKGTVIDKDPPSDPMDKDRHLIDCVSYILLDDRRFIDQRGCLSTFEPIYPNLAKVILAPWDHYCPLGLVPKRPKPRCSLSCPRMSWGRTAAGRTLAADGPSTVF